MTLTPILPAHAAYNAEVEFESDIVYMESLDQGTVIFNKNADKKTPMASLTKITTAMVVLEKADDLQRVCTVTQDELDELAGTNSSTAGLVDGEQLTVEQLLYLLMVHSANEAAIILAHEFSGTTAAFVEEMNAYAAKLGCKDTHYLNPHGLDAEGHYTTARDLALIIRHALQNDEFTKIVGTPVYEMEATNKRDATKYNNTNSLLVPGSYYSYTPCKGIKTGTTAEAGYCLASYASQNGYTYLTIIIQGAEGWKNRTYSGGNTAFNETIRAYKWVFDNIKLTPIATPKDKVTQVNVDLGRKKDKVTLVPAQEVQALIPSSIDSSGISIELIPESLPKEILAPIKPGDKIGKAKVLYAGEELTTVDLAASEEVKRSWPATIWYYVKKGFGYWSVRIAALALLLLLIALLIWRRVKQKQQKDSNLNMIRIRHDVDGSGGSLRGVNTELSRGRKSSYQVKRESRRRHRSRSYWRKRR
ncbi:MAG: D-alanyl-D-alanine carboxypeptidase family protein [Acutalibacteraceae bacterium]|nr:D-alanyl-D-alanine carboxypeptidase family protein [Acutalibacteraceae bacterium]